MSDLQVSKGVRDAAESIRRGVGGKYDREHERALEAFARFERETLERAAKELVAYCRRQNEAGKRASFVDAERAIRSLTDRK